MPKASDEMILPNDRTLLFLYVSTKAALQKENIIKYDRRSKDNKSTRYYV